MIKNSLFFSFLLFLVVCQKGYCEIHEINSMKEIVPFIEKDTLLVFDIDNTLLEPTGNMGSDQWFYYLYKIYKINGWNDHEIETKAMNVWNKAQGLVKVKPVEEGTPDLILTQQNRGIKTLALTARTFDIADKTLEQLDSIHIRFYGHTIHEGDLKVSHEELHSKDDAQFKKGVIFVGESNDKGKVLSQYLKKLGISPKRVVYVDDKSKHVKNLDAALADLKIPYFGFRYGALDGKVRAYNTLMSEITDKSSAQLLIFGQL